MDDISKAVVALPRAATGDTLAQRIQRLQAEAQRLARQHVNDLGADMLSLRVIAEEIAEGGEAYPPGVRDLARRLAEDLGLKAATLEAIAARSFPSD